MTTIESLRNLQDRLHEPLSVHERVRLLNRIAEELYEREPARGVTMARESVGLARATGDTPGEAQALYCLGRNLFSIADYPAVFETQNDALALFRGMNDGEGRRSASISSGSPIASFRTTDAPSRCTRRRCAGSAPRAT
jgi:hypothetical protein